MTMQREIPVTSLSTVDIHQEHRIAAPPDSVFTILTDRIGEWWTHPYRLHEGESTIRVDRAPGGMVTEHWGGDFASWGTITRFEDNSVLEFSGQCGMRGAVCGLVRFTLTEDETATVLALSHQAFGMIGEETTAGYEEGWQTLLGNLRDIAETS